MASQLLLLLIRINLLLFLSCTFSPHRLKVTTWVTKRGSHSPLLFYLRLREDFRAPEAAAAAAAGADLAAAAFLAGVGAAPLLDEALPPLEAAAAFGVAFDCLGVGGGWAFLLPPLLLFLALL